MERLDVISTRLHAVLGMLSGRIVILNYPTLEAGACECYGLVKREIEAFLRDSEVTRVPHLHLGTA